ncbi:unnamed protein product [Ilex paraguariensis]|uniref:Uncharacterized protein n=1 Tax=Ilex paraguariensis TaxID=185542 RepID=A0ABC8QQQ9_9AQUA
MVLMLKSSKNSLTATSMGEELESEPLQHMISGSPCSMLSSPFQLKPQLRDMFTDSNSRSKPVGDVINLRGKCTNHHMMEACFSGENDIVSGIMVETAHHSIPQVCNSTELSQKRQSFNLDELLGHYSPPGPPFSSPGQNEEDDKDTMVHQSRISWQFNHSKLTNLANGIGSKTQKPNAKKAKSPELCRSMIPKLNPSPEN